MKVHELIEKLKTYDSDLEVFTILKNINNYQLYYPLKVCKQISGDREDFYFKEDFQPEFILIS